VYRVSALRIHLWILADGYPFKGVRRDLRKEFKRYVRRERRATRFDYDYRAKTKLSETQVSAYARRLGYNTDDILRLNFFSEKMAVRAVSELIWGDAALAIFPRVLVEMARSAGVPDAIQEVDLSASNVGGIFGSPDEMTNSGEQTLIHVSSADLYSGRARFIDMKAHFEKSASDYPNIKFHEKALKLLETNEAATVAFLSMFVVQAFRQRSASWPS
jgi:hypothetical protein